MSHSVVTPVRVQGGSRGSWVTNPFCSHSTGSENFGKFDFRKNRAHFIHCRDMVLRSWDLRAVFGFLLTSIKVHLIHCWGKETSSYHFQADVQVG